MTTESDDNGDMQLHHLCKHIRKPVDIFNDSSFYVLCLTVSSDRKTVFTGFLDGTIKSWNLETRQQINVFEGHTASVTLICVIGKTLFTCAEDTTARSWNIETGQQIGVFSGHTARVRSVCANEKTLFTCSSDKTAISWNVETGEQINVFRGHTREVVSVCVSGKTLFTCSVDNTARSWDVDSGQPINVFKGHTDYVIQGCVSPDGKTLFTCSDDRTARSWDTETGNQINVFEGHIDWIKIICISPDGETLFTGSRDKNANIWNSKTGELIDVIDIKFSDLHSFCMSPDGKTLCLVSSSHNKDYRVQFFNIKSDSLVSLLEGGADVTLENRDGKTALEILCENKDATSIKAILPYCKRVEPRVAHLILDELMGMPYILKLLLPLYITSGIINTKENRGRYELIREYNDKNNLLRVMSTVQGNKKADVEIFKIIHELLN
jgi:WD40 repeat protein